MLCPYRHKAGTKVVDSRLVRDARAVRRRRECRTCGVRFTTYEEYEVMRIIVRKRDGSREEYDREKLRAGVAKALEKRPQERRLEDIVAAIEQELFARAAKDGTVSARRIGAAALAQLATIDEVAYLRFASVYRSFGSAQSFRKELAQLEKRRGGRRKS